MSCKKWKAALNEEKRKAYKIWQVQCKSKIRPAKKEFEEKVVREPVGALDNQSIKGPLRDNRAIAEIYINYLFWFLLQKILGELSHQISS